MTFFFSPIRLRVIHEKLECDVNENETFSVKKFCRLN